MKVTVKTTPAIAAPLFSCADQMLKTATYPIPQSVPPHRMARAACAIDAWSSITRTGYFALASGRSAACSCPSSLFAASRCGPATPLKTGNCISAPERYRGAGRSGGNYEGVPPTKVEASCTGSPMSGSPVPRTINSRSAMVGVLGLQLPGGLRPALRPEFARLQAFAIVRHVRFSRSLPLV